MLKTRVITACALAIGFLLAVFFLPDWAWAMAVAGVVWVATGEWSRLVAAGPVARHTFGVLTVAPVVAWGFVQPDTTLLAFCYIGALTFWAFAVPVFLRFKMRLQGGIARFGYGALILVSTAFALIELRRASPLFLLALMAPVWIADIAAFFVGRKWGRVKLAPTISPGKSREGVMGALVAVALYAVVLHTFAPAFSSKLSFLLMLGLSVVFTVLSVGGDLFESLLKRLADVKDSGTLLPGHGGVLDRIDSLLSTMPFAGFLWLIFQ